MQSNSIQGHEGHGITYMNFEWRGNNQAAGPSNHSIQARLDLMGISIVLVVGPLRKEQCPRCGPVTLISTYSHRTLRICQRMDRVSVVDFVWSLGILCCSRMNRVEILSAESISSFFATPSPNPNGVTGPKER